MRPQQPWVESSQVSMSGDPVALFPFVRIRFVSKSTAAHGTVGSSLQNNRVAPGKYLPNTPRILSYTERSCEDQEASYMLARIGEFPFR